MNTNSIGIITINTGKKAAMYKATLRGHYWIIGNGTWDTPSDLDSTMSTTRTISQGFQRHPFNGFRICSNQKTNR